MATTSGASSLSPQPPPSAHFPHLESESLRTVGLEVEVGRKQLQVAVADILGEQGCCLSTGG